ncbi:MAG TPA: metallophosphoesterase [Bacteroidia bacterium]|nr:metallophosphoesterase [Bacteroidia bacterium]
MQNKRSLSGHYILTLLFLFHFLSSFAQTHSIILGRPTDVSITASIQFDYDVDCYLEYGTNSGVYTNTIPVFNNTANIPDEKDLQNLMPDTKYYYRMQYRAVGAVAYTPTAEYSFHTQRAQGSTYTFTIEADEHLYDKKGVDNMYRITLENEAADNPDFMITLGDIFGDDHTPSTTTLADMDTLHNAYRPFLSNICHSVPFYVCLGNHEGENDYYLDSMPPNNIGVSGTLTRKKYYPNPFPNGFYSGNTVQENFGMDLPENYYAWTWGDALFIVLDVYRTECHDTLVAKPQGWNWTLGQSQYNWLLNTLQSSTARYKFVFAHHLRGQGRGAVLEAPLYEWGGYQNTGGSYTFATHRPGWPMSIHELFVQYGVNIFFQGHDHLFAHEVLDSVTYQEVPMAADSTYEIGMLANADAYTADTLDGTGHLRVTVAPSCVTVDFVRAYLPADTVSGVHQNREVAFSYTIGNCTSGLSQINSDEVIKIFPNPANSVLSVKLPEGVFKYKVELVNTLGESLLHSASNVMDISGIPDGIYLVRVHTDTSEFNRKMIICH